LQFRRADAIFVGAFSEVNDFKRYVAKVGREAREIAAIHVAGF